MALPKQTESNACHLMLKCLNYPFNCKLHTLSLKTHEFNFIILFFKLFLVTKTTSVAFKVKYIKFYNVKLY